MTSLMYMRADLCASLGANGVDLTKFLSKIIGYSLKYKIDIGDDGATMFMYGGVDPTDESQLKRMRDKIDETYMLFVFAHTVDITVYDPDTPLSDSEDETLAFGPPFFGICEATSDFALFLAYTPPSVHGGKHSRGFLETESVGGVDPICATSEAESTEGDAVVDHTGAGGADLNLPTTPREQPPPLAPSHPPPDSTIDGGADLTLAVIGNTAGSADADPTLAVTGDTAGSGGADPTLALTFTSIALAADIALAGVMTIFPHAMGIHLNESNGYICLWFSMMSWGDYTATDVDGHITLFQLGRTKLPLEAGKQILSVMVDHLQKKVHNAKKLWRRPPIVGTAEDAFTSKVALANTSVIDYAYVNLLSGPRGLYPLCHELVALGTKNLGISKFQTQKQFHASFYLQRAPSVQERIPWYMEA